MTDNLVPYKRLHLKAKGPHPQVALVVDFQFVFVLVPVLHPSTCTTSVLAASLTMPLERAHGLIIKLHRQRRIVKF